MEERVVELQPDKVDDERKHGCHLEEEEDSRHEAENVRRFEVIQKILKQSWDDFIWTNKIHFQWMEIIYSNIKM